MDPKNHDPGTMSHVNTTRNSLHNYVLVPLQGGRAQVGVVVVVVVVIWADVAAADPRNALPVMMRERMTAPGRTCC